VIYGFRKAASLAQAKLAPICPTGDALACSRVMLCPLNLEQGAAAAHYGNENEITRWITEVYSLTFARSVHHR